MKLALILFVAVAVLELISWLPLLWRWRKYWGAALTILNLGASFGLVALHWSGWTVLLAFFSLYRAVNLLRLIEGRTQADYLFRIAWRSSWLLIGCQGALLVVAAANHHYQLSTNTWWYGVAACQLIGGLIVVLSTNRHLRTTKAPVIDAAYADRDLPTLTVAIPARNETDDLDACLQSLIGNSYPKLEIIVLDDCSQERRTPEIIRGFAHDGVRFIAGEVPPEHWLAKNYAYYQLAKEANGELLLFCGVDARFSHDSLRAIVETMLVKKKSMTSFIPSNVLPKGFETLLVQPARYAWELSLPRRFLNRPPVLSTCWAITAQALHAAGGFKAVAHSTSPESYFARQTAAQSDGYSFMQSDSAIGLSSTKTLDEQRFTAIRTRYPQLHRRPELVGLISLAEFVTLVLPFGVLVGSLVARVGWLALLSGIAVVLLSTFYTRITDLTYRRFLARGLWLLPFAALYDLGLLHYSFWQYEFGEVIWKDRNICVPVMRAIPTCQKSKTA